MLSKQYNHGQLKQGKQIRENLKKFSSCLAQCLNACVHQTPVANFGSPKIFLLGIRFVSSLQEESQLIPFWNRNCVCTRSQIKLRQINSEKIKTFATTSRPKQREWISLLTPFFLTKAVGDHSVCPCSPLFENAPETQKRFSRMISQSISICFDPNCPTSSKSSLLGPLEMLECEGTLAYQDFVFETLSKLHGTTNTMLGKFNAAIHFAQRRSCCIVVQVTYQVGGL